MENPLAPRAKPCSGARSFAGSRAELLKPTVHPPENKHPDVLRPPRIQPSELAWLGSVGIFFEQDRLPIGFCPGHLRRDFAEQKTEAGLLELRRSDPRAVDNDIRNCH